MKGIIDEFALENYNKGYRLPVFFDGPVYSLPYKKGDLVIMSENGYKGDAAKDFESDGEFIKALDLDPSETNMEPAYWMIHYGEDITLYDLHISYSGTKPLEEIIEYLDTNIEEIFEAIERVTKGDD